MLTESEGGTMACVPLDPLLKEHPRREKPGNRFVTRRLPKGSRTMFASWFIVATSVCGVISVHSALPLGTK